MVLLSSRLRQLLGALTADLRRPGIVAVGAKGMEAGPMAALERSGIDFGRDRGQQPSMSNGGGDGHVNTPSRSAGGRWTTGDEEDDEIEED